MNEILEALMVVSFGLSWPASIHKSYTSRSSKGKSLFFMTMIAIGYVCGIIWKVNEYRTTGQWYYPGYFYILNLMMVIADICLYFRNRRLERQAEGR